MLRTPPGFESCRVRFSNQHLQQPETPRHAFFDVPSPVFPPMHDESTVQMLPFAENSWREEEKADAIVAKLQSEIRKLTAVTKLQFENSAADKVKLEAIIRNQSSELATTRARNKQEQRDSQAKIAHLNQQINDFQEAKKHKMHELEEIRRSLESLQVKHESAETKALMMNEEIKESHEKIKAMEVTISNQHDQLANTRAKATQFEGLYRDSEATVTLLKRQNNDLQGKLILADKKMGAMEANTCRLSNELASRLTLILKLQRQFCDLTDRKKQMQIALDAKNTRLVNTINSLQSERNKFEIQVNILTQVMERSDGTISSLKAQNAELTKKVESLERVKGKSNFQEEVNLSLAGGNNNDCSQLSPESSDANGVDIYDTNTSAVKSKVADKIGKLQAHDNTNAPIVTCGSEKENASTSCNQANNSETGSIKVHREESKATTKRSRALKQLESHLQSPKRVRKYDGSVSRRLRERRGQH